MWYSKEKPELDYSKPIIAEYNGAHPELQSRQVILPMIKPDSYFTIGYNWFNIDKGEWSSCSTFKTIEEALAARPESAYTIYNGEFTK